MCSDKGSSKLQVALVFDCGTVTSRAPDLGPAGAAAELLSVAGLRLPEAVQQGQELRLLAPPGRRAGRRRRLRQRRNALGNLER